MKNFKTTPILVIFFLFCFTLLGIDSLRQESATFDESEHLAAGYSYWKTGDYRLNPEHPPLIKMIAALPLLLFNPTFPKEHIAWEKRLQFVIGDIFLYHNSVDAEKMLYLGRIMLLLVITILLGWIIYRWGTELYGHFGGLSALFFFSFCPPIIAHTKLITTDMGLTCFFFLSIYLLWKLKRNPSIYHVILFGLAFGAALESKYSAILLFPICSLLIFLWISEQYKKTKWTKESARILYYTAVFFVVTFSVVFLVSGCRINNLHWYWIGLNKVLTKSADGMPSFLIGKYSTDGWWYYFLITFLLKTPIPFLILLCLGIRFSSLKESNYVRKEILWLLIPVIIYFFIASFSKVQIGHRYILPIYPFLFVWAGGISSSIQGKFRYLLLGGLAVWYAGNTLYTHPHHLSYFNEFVGHPSNGYKYLVESNLDWGQGLKLLGRYLKSQHVQSIYFSYFGTADPAYYGIKYVPISFVSAINRTGDEVNPLDEHRCLFAISATNLQGVYTQGPNRFSWLKTRSPIKIIANSIFVYDITDDVEAHEILARYFTIEKQYDKSINHYKQIVKLNPENGLAYQCLGNIYYIQGRKDLAKKYWGISLNIEPNNPLLKENLKKLSVNLKEC
ncbi:MAG: glycosyltransferase family 39 protein [Elusimicrobiota bacterium]